MVAVHISEAGLLALGDQKPRGPAGHAQAILRAADHVRSAVGPDRIPLGELHRAVLELRASIIGEVLDCTTPCPACDTTLSFEVAVADLCAVNDPTRMGAPVEVVIDGISLIARPPSTSDLRAAVTDVGSGTDADVRAALIARCVTATDADQNIVPTEQLTDDAVAAIAQQLDEVDPLLDPRFGLTCYSCAHGFEASIDVGAFVFGELAARGRQLLYEIDALAVRYGWTEAEILALPSARRARYLELVG